MIVVRRFQHGRELEPVRKRPGHGNTFMDKQGLEDLYAKGDAPLEGWKDNSLSDRPDVRREGTGRARNAYWGEGLEKGFDLPILSKKGIELPLLPDVFWKTPLIFKDEIEDNRTKTDLERPWADWKK
jgi:hypothetical protein